MTEQLTSSLNILDDLEKLAEGFESRNFHFVTLCLSKILTALVPNSSHQEENEASSTAGVPEAHKTIKAIDSGDFELAGLCFRKAIRAFSAEAPLVKLGYPREARIQLDQIASHMERKEFSSIADNIRRLASMIRNPDEAPQAQPSVPPEEAAVGVAAAAATIPVEQQLRQELSRVEKERDQLLEDLNLARARLLRLRQYAANALTHISQEE